MWNLLLGMSSPQPALNSAVALCSDKTQCLPNCDSALQSLSTTVGCCLNNFLNNSELVLGDLGEYETLVSNELWKECGVETPGLCLYEDGDDDDDNDDDDDDDYTDVAQYRAKYIQLLVPVTCNRGNKSNQYETT